MFPWRCATFLFIYLFRISWLVTAASVRHTGEKRSRCLYVSSQLVFSLCFLCCFCFLFLWSGWCLKMCWEPKERERAAIRSGKRNSPFLLLLPLFYNTVPKLGSASLLFSSHMTLLSHGGCTTLDCRGVSLANDPVWKFSPLKAYQKYLVRIRRAALNDGPPVETALHLDTCKNQPVQCVSRWLLGYPFKNNVSHLAVQTFIRFYRMGEKAT